MASPDRPNPYNAAKPGNLFRGYGRLRRSVRSGLLGGRSYSLQGGRRCGKTSLLLQLRSDLEGDPDADVRLLPRFLDVQARIPRSPEEFFRGVSELLCQGSPVSPWTGAGAASQPYQRFLEYLDSAAVELSEHHGGRWLLVLLVDELDIAAGYLDDDECFHNLRHLLMTSRHAASIRVVASGLTGLSQLIAVGSPLNNLEPLFLGRLRPADADELIAAGFASLPQECRERLLELTGGHPYLLQGVLEYLWEERKQVDAAALAGAVRQFVRNRDSVFARWLVDFGPAGRALYRELSDGEAPADKSRLAAALPPGTSWNQAVSVLAYHGVIDDADLDQPAIAGTMFQSWHRGNRELVLDSTGSGGAAAEPSPTQSDPDSRRDKRVFVVFGRNRKIYVNMLRFLRALKLEPVEWDQMVDATGKGAPYIGEIVEQGFAMAGAAVVLLTPDDEGRLRERFHQEHDPPSETELTPQPRPNVIFEAGMAMALAHDKTILVRFGRIRVFSDIAGMFMLDMDGSIKARQRLANRLRSCGLEVDTSSDADWQSAGDFELD